MTAGSTRTGIDTKQGSSGVPAGARAVLMNLTVTGTVGTGWVTLFANGQSVPVTSNINWSAAGTTVATLAVVPCDSNALVSAFASNVTDFILDVVGYYQ
jgi:hypothetical protein